LQHRPLKAAVKAFNKSVERNEAGDLAASLALLEKSVSIDPNYVPALNNLGARYTRLGRFADAAVAFERAITQAPSNPMLHANFAHALLHLREYLRAETAARRSVELDRSYAPAAYYLGLSLLSQKKITAETIVWLRKGRTLGDRAELALGAALAHTGSHREAREVLEGCQNASEPAVAAEARLLLSRLP
jgi:tetratricopeptide (TPR) repeat protein